MTKTLSLCIVFLFCFSLNAQTSFQQYFDGADTSASNSLFPKLDTTGIWQIGTPSKLRFNTAFTQPRAILTDSALSYPINDTSTFMVPIGLNWFNNGILAVEWVQSLDLEEDKDFGFVEFRTSDTAAWSNIFDNNYVYNVFGFDSANVKQHQGRWGFTGLSDRDNVWVCLDLSWLWQVSPSDTVYFRYQIISDSIDSQQDGWMLDNFSAHLTAFHTINENKTDAFLQLSPNPSKGIVNISARKTGTVQYIESIELVDLKGMVIKRWGLSPTKFSIDLSDQAAGTYILRINSNLKKEEFRIILHP